LPEGKGREGNKEGKGNDSLRSSAAPSDINAGTIVGAWVDAFMAPEGRQRPSESMRKQAGKQARDLIEGGAKPDLVLETAKLAGGKGYATIEREYAPLLAAPRNGRSLHLKDWVEQ
jgi:hypothetical protein